MTVVVDDAPEAGGVVVRGRVVVVVRDAPVGTGCGTVDETRGTVATTVVDGTGREAGADVVVVGAGRATVVGTSRTGTAPAGGGVVSVRMARYNAPRPRNSATIVNVDRRIGNRGCTGRSNHTRAAPAFTRPRPAPAEWSGPG